MLHDKYTGNEIIINCLYVLEEKMGNIDADFGSLILVNMDAGYF